MHLKSTSKTLHRTNNEALYSIQYHNTIVLSFDKLNNAITLKTDGWETMNTAKSMTIGLEEAGIEAHVECRNNKKEQGLFLVINGNRHKVYNGMTVNL